MKIWTRSLALTFRSGLAACQGAASVPGEVVVKEFELATATSWALGDRIRTELRGPDQQLLASADWDLESQSGVLAMGEESSPIQAGGEEPLDPATANLHTYAAWQMPREEVAYDEWEPATCHNDVDTENCIYCFSCTTCKWVVYSYDEEGTYFSGIYCVVGGGGCFPIPGCGDPEEGRRENV
jgi:hypothetical protein